MNLPESWKLTRNPWHPHTPLNTKKIRKFLLKKLKHNDKVITQAAEELESLSRSSSAQSSEEFRLKVVDYIYNKESSLSTAVSEIRMETKKSHENFYHSPCKNLKKAKRWSTSFPKKRRLVIKEKNNFIERRSKNVEEYLSPWGEEKQEDLLSRQLVVHGTSFYTDQDIVENLSQNSESTQKRK